MTVVFVPSVLYWYRAAVAPYSHNHVLAFILPIVVVKAKCNPAVKSAE